MPQPKYYHTHWTNRPCPICGENEQLEPLGYREVQCGVDDGYCVFRHNDVGCRICGFVFNRQIPPDEFLEDFYTRTTLELEKTYSGEKRIGLIKRFVTPKKAILEVGGARGEFVTLLRNEDYDTDVKEVGDPWPDKEYDAVVAYFVLEHVCSPRDFLKRIWKCLRWGGVLIIEVPNFRTHTEHSMFREHFNHFTQWSLRSLLLITSYQDIEYHQFSASRDYGLVMSASKRADRPALMRDLYLPTFEHMGHYWKVEE